MNKKFVFRSHYYPKALLEHPWLIVFYYLFVLLYYPRYLIFIFEFSRHIKNQRSKKILEIGFGEGLHLILFALRYRKNTFYGYDVREENRLFVDRFCALFRLKNVHLLNDSDFRALSADSFEFVYMVGVLQYVENDMEILLKIKNLLKPNGKLLLYQPVRYKRYLNLLHNFIESYEHYEKEVNIKRLYSEFDLLQLLKSAGYTIDSCKKYAIKIYSISHEIFLVFYIPFVKDHRVAIKLISSFGILGLTPILLILNLIDRMIKVGDNNTVMTIATLSPVNELI
ncbi:class I SAM-dependent methyltransferase [Thermaurantimonas aggregans]|nr:class I SAM-dependent methyltransferase [Thermaurantimonas aggregans]